MNDAAEIRLLVFRVGALVCAAEVDRVREILPRLAATRIPGAPPTVAGLVNIRGMLVTVVEGWRALNQPAPERADDAATPAARDAGGAATFEPAAAEAQGRGSTILLEAGGGSRSGRGAGGGGDVGAGKGPGIGGIGGEGGTGAATPRRIIGLTVDEVMDFLVVSAGSLEPRQALPGLDPILVRAVGRRAGSNGESASLVVVLDLDALLAPILS
jgi:chemotaxis signal transduction protein